jgi:hypothetical protein
MEDGAQPEPSVLRPGARVELGEAIYGYEAGTRGVVLRLGDGGSEVLVRLEPTAHALFVAPDRLRPSPD